MNTAYKHLCMYHNAMKKKTVEKLPDSPSSDFIDKDDFSGIPYNEYKKKTYIKFFSLVILSEHKLSLATKVSSFILVPHFTIYMYSYIEIIFCKTHQIIPCLY